jgi:hypothetical protein
MKWFGSDPEGFCNDSGGAPLRSLELWHPTLQRGRHVAQIGFSPVVQEGLNRRHAAVNPEGMLGYGIVAVTVPAIPADVRQSPANIVRPDVRGFQVQRVK